MYMLEGYNIQTDIRYEDLIISNAGSPGVTEEELNRISDIYGDLAKQEGNTFFRSKTSLRVWSSFGFYKTE